MHLTTLALGQNGEESLRIKDQSPQYFQIASHGRRYCRNGLLLCRDISSSCSDSLQIAPIVREHCRSIAKKRTDISKQWREIAPRSSDMNQHAHQRRMYCGDIDPHCIDAQ
jgi:hypothetical protein